jgi:hypothetical protein
MKLDNVNIFEIELIQRKKSCFNFGRKKLLRPYFIQKKRYENFEQNILDMNFEQ